jgi:Mn2+/Fe2+ NRAMP family transporter
VWLPIVLIFIVLLSSRRDLMGDFANSKTFAAIAWITSVLVIILTMVLIFAAIFPSKLGGVPGL